MKGPSPKVDPLTIKKLMVVGEKQGTIRLSHLAKEMELSAEDTLVLLRSIFPGGQGAEIYTENNECMVDIDAEALQYMLPLSPSEWIQLHELLEKVTPSQAMKNPVLNSLKKKVTENGPIKVVMELLNQLELWDQQLDETQQALILKLEAAMKSRHLVEIATNQDKTYHVFPNRIIHLEGKLSLIAEDSQDHCLMVTGIQELKAVEDVDSTSAPKVMAFEVDEFITAIRSMGEKETRLILKIHDPQSVNLFPEHHFLGKPCMITNPNGDLIWAAYVESCDDLFDWLITLGTNVEILDPGRFKDEYLIYCEEKLKKIA